MKKTFLFMSLLLGFVVSGMLVSSCDDDEGGTSSHSIQGIWRITEYYEKTSYSNGHGYEEYTSLEESGHYEYLILEESGGGWHYNPNPKGIQSTERFYKWDFKNNKLITYYDDQGKEGEYYEYKVSFEGSDVIRLTLFEFDEEEDDGWSHEERMTLIRIK